MLQSLEMRIALSFCHIIKFKLKILIIILIFIYSIHELKIKKRKKYCAKSLRFFLPYQAEENNNRAIVQCRSIKTQKCAGVGNRLKWNNERQNSVIRGNAGCVPAIDGIKISKLHKRYKYYVGDHEINVKIKW